MKKSASAHRSKTRGIHTPKKSILLVCVTLISAFLLISVGFSWLRLQTFCANSISCISNPISIIENHSLGMFQGHTVVPPIINLAMDTQDSKVLGETVPAGDKHIFVDLNTQTLYAFQGNTVIMNTLISSGKWGRTPTGDFRIWSKLRSTRMSGGSGNDAYDLPNVPFVMFFYNEKVSKERGFSFHGAYWHNNFGHAMSHGCVNMRTIDAEELFNWADPPTKNSTTYATAENSGTLVSICSQLYMQPESLPTCIE